MKQFNRVFARVDLDAVSYNMEQMRRRIGEGAQIIAVIKMDGYGHGAVPIAEMFKYATDLRSMTQGRGTFSFDFVRYEEAPANVVEKVMEKAKNKNE